MKRILIPLLISAILLCASIIIADKDKVTDLLTVKTKKGLKFRVPEDWPIEERNGVVGPIPIEEYVSIKFGEIESRVAEIEKIINKIRSDMQELQKLKDEIESIKQQKDHIEKADGQI